MIPDGMEPLTPMDWGKEKPAEKMEKKEGLFSDDEKPVELKKAPMQSFKDKLQKLEKSDIGPALKEIMNEWVLFHLTETSEAKQAYIDKVKEGGVGLAEMMEGMVDLYLVQDQEAMKRVQENRKENLPKVFEGMFDRVFTWALRQNEGDKEKTERVQNVLSRFKEVVAP